MNAHPSLSDWAASGSLDLSAIGLIALALAFADADPSDVDPRQLLDTDLPRRLLDTGFGARVLVEVVNARTAARDAALTVAALLMLLTAAPEATR